MINNVNEFDSINNLLYVLYNILLSSILLQMVSYKICVNKGINPDMPKNLAKFVTVE
jgi:glucosamine 6-phosphate synthetase-like amidotransferase/phosphosugar isomerase protein